MTTKTMFSCPLGHPDFHQTPARHRASLASGNSGCPKCGRERQRRTVTKATVAEFPELAALLRDVDPHTVPSNSTLTFEWECPRGHKFARSAQTMFQSVVRLKTGTFGCPECKALSCARQNRERAAAKRQAARPSGLPSAPHPVKRFIRRTQRDV